MAQVAQKSKRLRRLSETNQLEYRVLHRWAGAAGLKEFPSAPMQRAKIATQSLADE